jgi:hypothetical protein
MALPGEIGHSFGTCADCAQVLVPRVLRSGAGFYIGTFCHCGPYSRESPYMSETEARAALEALDWPTR